LSASTMPNSLKQAADAVDAGCAIRAGFDSNQARREVGDQLKQPSALDAGANQGWLAALVQAKHGEDVLCQVDSDGDNGHDFPFQVS